MTPRTGGLLRCPFCRDQVLAFEATWRCLGCRTLHHEECARENGSCTVRGCTGAPRVEPVPVRWRATAHSFDRWQTRIAGLVALGLTGCAVWLGLRILALDPDPRALTFVGLIVALTATVGARDVLTGDPNRSWSGSVVRWSLECLRDG